MTTFEPAPGTDFRAPAMAMQSGRCAICGNGFDNDLQISMDGVTHELGCCECAIHALASNCERCGCCVIGQGMNVRGTLYCSLHCAENDA